VILFTGSHCFVLSIPPKYGVMCLPEIPANHIPGRLPMTALTSHNSSELNPLDVAEALFESRDWLFDRPVEEELVAEIVQLAAGSGSHDFFLRL
jgi:hypothetical protein